MSITNYRAWNTKSKSMYHFDLYDLGVDQAPLSSTDPLMQSTNLLDKNGKEIYEGDVLKYSWNDGDAERSETYEVCRASNARFYARNIGFPNEDAMLAGPRAFEIIGNIYEHHNLLQA